MEIDEKHVIFRKDDVQDDGKIEMGVEAQDDAGEPAEIDPSKIDVGIEDAKFEKTEVDLSRAKPVVGMNFDSGFEATCMRYNLRFMNLRYRMLNQRFRLVKMMCEV